jgi:hypothetical protein
MYSCFDSNGFGKGITEGCDGVRNCGLSNGFGIIGKHGLTNCGCIGLGLTILGWDVGNEVANAGVINIGGTPTGGIGCGLTGKFCKYGDVTLRGGGSGTNASSFITCNSSSPKIIRKKMMMTISVQCISALLICLLYENFSRQIEGR